MRSQVVVIRSPPPWHTDPARAADYNAGVDEATASPGRPGQDGRRGTGLPPAKELALRDGTRILVRPILPADKDRLREGFVRLSVRSRYRRFLTSLEHLSDQQVRHLTEIDYADHMAWVAVDPSRPGWPGMGVARYVRLPEEPTAAEAAVTVLDEYQGKGVGTILLRMLAGSARQHGIRSFRGYVLAENAPMMDILHDLGATVTQEGPLLRVDVPIPATADELPDTPTGRVFKSVARGALPPFRLHYPGTPDH
jgi:GNAT superfamily N-acetyltransferase